MKAFVTGGGGFLGLAIVRILRARGDEVTSYSRTRHPEVEALGARSVEGDVADVARLNAAIAGHECVFHVAAKAGIWGDYVDYARVNIVGTTAVLAAAMARGVPRFVFTSSPSVCFDGRDHLNAGNDLPHAETFLCAYPRTKAQAERHVLTLDGHGIATCALRPHLIVGPGDPHILPRLAQRARAGRLAIVGDGKNRVSLTDVENAAWAHVDAADHLSSGAAHAGHAYFIAQNEPFELWPWLTRLFTDVGLPPPRRRVPLALARAAGATCEFVWDMFDRAGEPPMTRFLALQLARSHTYDTSAARRDFGWRQRIDNDALTLRCREWLRVEVKAGRI